LCTDGDNISSYTECTVGDLRSLFNHLNFWNDNQRLRTGFFTPRSNYSFIWSLNFISAYRTSLDCFSTISKKINYTHLRLSKGANSNKAVSYISSNQLFMNIPLSGCLLKFSATLSTMIVLCKGLPILLKSLIKTIPVGLACWRYSLYEM